ncbi:hypothetical protein BcepF1.031 [Burkholderia phage BcepF1]|uniref:Uncharacterized protein n=1 Tax=Burkholderia phage BcepF1 TaxID=2886897 RepID=A1YZT5_9CAUD|nr:hypothetical protein BcepF1.031 [Burkholderia phage BcepF1]ABL96762.1 hypothetical protein BcepF1.031 [Burkholderia phage BcepF1]
MANLPKLIRTNFDDGNFFQGSEEGGSIRIGMNGYRCISLPVGNKFWAEASEALDADAIEALFDKCVENGLIPL